MPRYPVYADLLPQEAQDVIGRTHRDTAPARKMLEAEGLRYQGHVDIFDAGPVLECHVNDLRTVRESVVVPVAIGTPSATDDVRSLVSNTSMLGFRVGTAPGGVEEGAMRLSADDAAALEVSEGDLVRVLMSSNKPKKD